MKNEDKADLIKLKILLITKINEKNKKSCLFAYKTIIKNIIFLLSKSKKTNFSIDRRKKMRQFLFLSANHYHSLIIIVIGKSIAMHLILII